LEIDLHGPSRTDNQRVAAMPELFCCCLDRQLAVRDERLALLWFCPNCHGEWLSAGEDDDPEKSLFVKR